MSPSASVGRGLGPSGMFALSRYALLHKMLRRLVVGIAIVVLVSFTPLNAESKPLSRLTARFWAVKKEKFSLFTFFFDRVFTSLVPKVFENHRFDEGERLKVT